MSRLKFVFIALALCFMGGWVYLLVLPISGLSLESIFRTKIQSVSEAKDYYSVVASLYSMVVATVGIGLGFYYFFRKNRLESEMKVRDRCFSRIEELHKQLNSYDSAVDNILALKVTSQPELDSSRHTVRRSFEIVNAILDVDTALLTWSNDELKSILQVNSFVDKSELIMNISFEELKSSKLLKVEYEMYLGYLQEARKVCFSKSDKLYV